METEWGQNGDRMGTEWRQKSINDYSDKGFIREVYLYMVFMQILHDDVHEKLTAFSSMPCCCIFKNEFFYYDTEDANHYPTVLLVAKWTFFQILLVLSTEPPLWYK